MLTMFEQDLLYEFRIIRTKETTINRQSSASIQVTPDVPMIDRIEVSPHRVV